MLGDPADAAIVRELNEISVRLAMLRDEGGDAAAVGQELGAIRVQLRLMVQQNAEVGARLAQVLGLEAADYVGPRDLEG